MEECYKCGFYNYDYEQCTCNPADKWYACPIESREPENVKALEDYARSIQYESKINNAV